MAPSRLWRQDRAAVDRNQMVGTRRRKADLEHIVRAAPGMKYGAAAAVAMGIDQLGDRRVEPGLAQRLDDEIALPGAIAGGVPVLHGAAAAHAEMRANRRDALRARRVDVQKPPPVGMAGDVLDLDRFAGQRAGNIDRPSAPSATPSPRWPSRSIRSRSTTRRPDEEFAIAVAAEDRRGHQAADAPSQRSDETRRCRRRPLHAPPHRA